MSKIPISFKKPTGSVVTLMLLLSPATYGQQPGGAVGEGARVYGTMCGRCHNPRSPLERTDREWVTIANHMRVRGNLTGPEVRSVLAFLQATNTDPLARTPLPTPVMEVPEAPSVATGPVSTDPAVIAQGEVLVAEKACLGCHVIGAQGGPVGPRLNGVVSRRGAVFVRQKLTTPAFNNATSMMPNFGLTPEQVEAITAYLATFNRR